jgi:protein-S-isoprenylcysteine O-methyltransferase Ste14
MVELGRIFFRYRNGLAPLLILVAIAVGGPRVLSRVPHFDVTLDVMGFLSVLAGQSLRIVTIGYEYIERGGRDRKVYASELVQGGMFAHSRNPLYVGNLFMIGGYAMIVNSIAFYALVVPISLLAYIAIVSAEEAFLAEKFGVQYSDYCRRVPRWWPDWAGWPKSVEGMRFNWRRVAVKEYNTLFVSMALLVGLKVWSDYRAGDACDFCRPEYLAVATVAWLVLYLIVRALKKKGYLKG